jgi:hypothetical protein
MIFTFDLQGDPPPSAGASSLLANPFATAIGGIKSGYDWIVARESLALVLGILFSSLSAMFFNVRRIVLSAIISGI